MSGRQITRMEQGVSQSSATTRAQTRRQHRLTLPDEQIDSSCLASSSSFSPSSLESEPQSTADIVISNNPLRSKVKPTRTLISTPHSSLDSEHPIQHDSSQVDRYSTCDEYTISSHSDNESPKGANETAKGAYLNDPRSEDCERRVKSGKRQREEATSDNPVFKYEESEWIKEARAKRKKDGDRRHRERTMRQRQEAEAVHESDAVKSAEILYGMLNGSPPGCDEEEHALRDTQRRLSGETCLLAGTFNEYVFRGRRKTDVGLAVPGFPRKSDVTRHAYPSREQLQQEFEGTSTEDPYPPTIDLSLEHASAEIGDYARKFDTDSCIGSSATLAVFNSPVTFCQVYAPTKNISTNLHFQVSIPGQGGVTKQLRDMAHMYAGQMISGHGFHGAHVYFVLPEYPVSDDNNYVKKIDWATWYDRVWAPAIRDTCGPEAASYQSKWAVDLELKSRAENRENGSNTGGPRKMIHWPLPHQKYATLWQKVHELIKHGGKDLRWLQNMFVVFDAKNMKHNFHDAYTLYQSMEQFDDSFAQVFNEVHIKEDDLVLDPAIAVHPNSFGLATTLLPRKCCVKKTLCKIKEKGFNGKQGTYNEYTIANLAEAISVTLEPPKNCLLYRGGFRYLQLYPIVKALLEACGFYPFENPELLCLAIEGKLFEHLAGNGIFAGIKRQRLEHNWAELKNRLYQQLTLGSYDGFGFRFELRITRRLWRSIKRIAAEGLADTPQESAQLPAIVWAISTHAYVDYVRGNYNKYISLAEMCMTIGSATGRSLGRTYLIHVVIMVLQAFLNENLATKRALWVSQVETGEPGKNLLGLGFQSSMLHHGYCWIQPGIIDWENLEISPEAMGRIAGLQNKYLMPGHREGNSLIEDQANVVTVVLRHLSKAMPGGALEDTALKVLAHFLLRHYRRSVLQSLDRQKDLRDVVLSRLGYPDPDAHPFSDIGWRTMLIRDMQYLRNGKSLCKHPELLFKWLWTEEPGFARNSFEGYGYWKELKNVRRLIAQHVPGCKGPFEKILYEEFFTYHSVVPYPHTNGTIISRAAKRGEKRSDDARQLYAWKQMFWKGGLQQRWVWAKDDPVTHNPPAVPSEYFLRGHSLESSLEFKGLEDDRQFS